MSKKNTITINFEYAALRAASALAKALPYRATMWLAKMFALFSVSVLRLHRKRTFERIRSVFPGISDAEVKRIAKGSLINLFQTAAEMMCVSSLDRKWMDRYIKDGAAYKDKLQSYIDEGNGAVIMVPHSGNWYMAAWSMAKYGLPLFAIAAKQRNPKIDAWMNRQYAGIDVVERGSARTLVEIMRKLREGRGFAILPDLRNPQPDVEVDFLGGKANVSHAGAMFAVKAGCPIVVAVMRREEGKHVFDHVATLRPNPNADKNSEAVRLTREVMRLLDERIRKHPEHWFWYNKRWILQPVSQPVNKSKKGDNQ